MKTVTITISDQDYADMVSHIAHSSLGRPMVAVHKWLNEQGQLWNAETKPLPKLITKADRRRVIRNRAKSKAPLFGGPANTPDEAAEKARSERAKVFNPENIEQGDTVRLDGDSKRMVVLSVGGTNGNKVYCDEIGHELYATCFKLVRKSRIKFGA